MAHRVLQQVAEHLVELVGIGPQLSQRARDRHPEPVRGVPGGDHRRDVPPDDGADVDGLTAYLQPPGVDPADVEQLGDEAGDPVGVGLHGLEHQAALRVGEALPLGEQGRGETLDAGQRGAQLVGDAGHELRPAGLLTRPGSGVAQPDHDARHRPTIGRLAQVARRDVHLAAFRQDQRPFGVPSDGAQARPRVDVVPPQPTLQVRERKRLGQRPPEHRDRVQAGDPDRGTVDGHDRAMRLGDDDAVGQVVVRRARHVPRPPAGRAPFGRSPRAVRDRA